MTRLNCKAVIELPTLFSVCKAVPHLRILFRCKYILNNKLALRQQSSF